MKRDQIKKNINRSIISQNHLAAALKDLGKSLDSKHVHLLLFNKSFDIINGMVVSNTYDTNDSQAVNAEYVEYKEYDERVTRFLDLNNGEIRNNRELFNRKELKTSCVYNEFLVKHDSQSAAISRLDGPEGTHIILGFIRSARRGEYNESELSNIQCLSPLIQNTIFTQHELGIATSSITALHELLDQNNCGIIFLNSEGKISETNDYAQLILNDRDGLVDEFGYLRAIDCRDNKQLKKKLLSTVINSINISDNSNQIFIKRMNKNTPYKLTITPIHKHHDLIINSPSVMIIIKKLDAIIEFPTELLQAHFGFTDTELVLTKAIFNDISLKEHAAAKKVKISTVRWTLGNIFSKTNTHSQKELKSLISRFSV